MTQADRDRLVTLKKAADPILATDRTPKAPRLQWQTAHRFF